MYKTQFEKINGFEYMFMWETEGSEEVNIYGRRNDDYPFIFIVGLVNISDFTENCKLYVERCLLHEQEEAWI